METIFDLPAHPLMVHFPAVAIPILALAAIALVFLPKARVQYRLLVIVLAVVTIVATFLAAKSGQALADGLNYPASQISDHRELGEMLRWFVLILGLSTIGMLTHVGTERGARLPAKAAVTIKAVVLLSAVLSLVWAVRTGHEGAKSVWQEAGALLVEEPSEGTAAAVTTAAPITTSAPAATTATPATPATTVTPATTSTATTVVTTESTVAVIVTLDPVVIYSEFCARCHGDQGQGVPPRPGLIGIGIEIADGSVVVDQVKNGGRFMPGFGSDLTPEQIAAVSQYVLDTF